MTAIIDYGVGNLFSLSCSFKAVGADTVISGDPEIIKKADRIILPGVGAFGDAAEKLKVTGLGELIKEEAGKGKPVMGICLGMQLLFEKSFEYGEHEGLGLLKGAVVPMNEIIPGDLPIPHIGWNRLHIIKGSSLLKYVKEKDCMYFVHSYCAVNCMESLTASTDYGAEITAMVEKDNVSGCQFHPEKSGKTGLSILKAFTEDRL